MSVLQLTALTVCLSLAAACSAPAPQLKDYPRRLADGEYTETLLDFHAWGVAEAKRFAGDSRFGEFFDEGKLRRTFTRGSVRVETSVAMGPDSTHLDVDSGSGLLFRSSDGIYLLTAGHVLGTSGGAGICSATTSKGVRAEMQSQKYGVPAIRGRDLALLKCKPEFEGKIGASVAVNLEVGRKPRRGEPVVVVGYPGGNIGVMSNGEVGMGLVRWGADLEPIFAFAEVDGTSPFTLRFVGGSVPTSGSSGSAVWAVDGALLGVLVDSGSSSDDGERIQIRSRCEPLQGLEGLVE